MEVLGLMAAMAFAGIALADFALAARAFRDVTRDQKRREAELLRRTRIEIEA